MSFRVSMTWDDGLSIDALCRHLRRVAPEAIPLIMFCVDGSSFLKQAKLSPYNRADLFDQYFDAASESSLLAWIKVKPQESGVVTNEFLHEALAEAEHLIVVNYFSEFLGSEEYKEYSKKQEELEKSQEALDTTSQKMLAKANWAPDTDTCMICQIAFNASRKLRRHHCRACGLCVCSKCAPSTNKKPIPAFGHMRPVRHCNNCFVEWVSDTEAKSCQICGAGFSLIVRRHHCRNCGKCVCGKCTPKRDWKPIPELGYTQKQRICSLCTCASPKLNRKPKIREHRRKQRARQAEEERQNAGKDA